MLWTHRLYSQNPRTDETFLGALRGEWPGSPRRPRSQISKGSERFFERLLGNACPIASHLHLFSPRPKAQSLSGHLGGGTSVLPGYFLDRSVSFSAPRAKV